MAEKLYFCSGWFNPAADEEERRVCNKLKELGYDVFSPREFFVLKPDATDEDRNRIFQENLKQIESCEVFFGISDYRDIGSIWEMGYVNGLNAKDGKNRKIAYYAETLPEGAPFNVMLAKSAKCIITKFSDLDRLPEWLESGHKYEGKVQ